MPIVIEPKINGYRIEIHRNGGVKIFTDGGKERSEILVDLTNEAKSLSADNFILDGELILLKDGQPVPRAEMARVGVGKESIKDEEIRYYVFDVPYYEGDISEKPLSERLKILDKILPKDLKYIKRMPSWEVSNKKEYDAAVKKAIDFGSSEGFMGKELESPYTIGRGPGWVKMKITKEIKIKTIGILKKPNPWDKKPDRDLTGQEALDAFKKLQEKSETYILRGAILGKDGKTLIPIESDHKLSQGDLELRWDAKREVWAGTDDPRIWQIGAGFKPRMGGEFALGKTYAKRLDPAPKITDIVTIRPTTMRFFKKADGTQGIAWENPRLEEIDTERKDPDSYQDAERIIEASSQQIKKAEEDIVSLAKVDRDKWLNWHLKIAPNKYPQYFAILSTHFRGKSAHGDFRVKFNSHLRGWTLDDQPEGVIKEDINTVEQGRKITDSVSWKFGPDMDPNKKVLCLGGNSYIVTNQGFTQIKYLKPGDKVLSADGKFHDVLDTFCSPRNGRRIYDIHAEGLLAFHCTEDHPILTITTELCSSKNTNCYPRLSSRRKRCLACSYKHYKFYKPVWKAATELTEQDYIGFPIPIFDNIEMDDLILENSAGYRKIIPFNRDFALFLGYFLGDGSIGSSVTTGQIYLFFNGETQQQLIEKYKKILATTLGIKDINFRKCSDKSKAVILHFTDRPLHQWIIENLTSKRNQSRYKKFPLWLLHINRELAEGLFEGLIDSDGYSLKNGQNYFSNINPEIAQGCWLLGFKINQYPTSLISTPNAKSQNRIFKMCFSNGYWKKNARFILDNYIFGKYKKKILVPNHTRYFDISVANHKSFAVPGALVHNSQRKAMQPLVWLNQAREIVVEPGSTAACLTEANVLTVNGWDGIDEVQPRRKIMTKGKSDDGLMQMEWGRVREILETENDPKEKYELKVGDFQTIATYDHLWYCAHIHGDNLVSEIDTVGWELSKDIFLDALSGDIQEEDNEGRWYRHPYMHMAIPKQGLKKSIINQFKKWDWKESQNKYWLLHPILIRKFEGLVTTHNLSIKGNENYLTSMGVSHNTKFEEGVFNTRAVGFAYPGCFPPGQQILTCEGMKSIEHIKEGDLVLGDKGRPIKVCKTFHREHKDSLVHLKARGFPSILLTPEHPVFIQRKLKFADKYVYIGKNAEGKYERKHRRFHEIIPYPKWLPANEVLLGDYIGIPRFEMRRPVFFEVGDRCFLIDKDLAWLLGFFIADGYANSLLTAQFAFYVGDSEQENLLKTMKIMDEKFKLKSKINQRIGCKQILYNSRELTDALRFNFYNPSGRKQIPLDLLELEDHILIYLLKGLYDGDGSRRNLRALSFSNTSPDVYIPFQLAMVKLGWCGSMGVYKPKKRNHKEVAQIIWTKKFLDLTLDEPIMSIPEYTMVLSDRNHLFLRVEKIEEIPYSGLVYNLETEDNTIMTPLKTHNSRKGWFEEYFLDMKGPKETYQRKRLVFRQVAAPKEPEKQRTKLKEPWFWQTHIAKTDTPYILSARGRKKRDWVPDGKEIISGLPPWWEEKIPEEMRWWGKGLSRGEMLDKIDQAYEYLKAKAKEKKQKQLIQKGGLRNLTEPLLRRDSIVPLPRPNTLDLQVKIDSFDAAKFYEHIQQNADIIVSIIQAQAKTVRFALKRHWWKGQCVHKRLEIATPGGLVEAGQLKDKDFILASDLKPLEVVKAQRIMFPRYLKVTYGLNEIYDPQKDTWCYGQWKISITENTPIWIRSRDDLYEGWIRADALKKGDQLKMPVFICPYCGFRAPTFLLYKHLPGCQPGMGRTAYGRELIKTAIEIGQTFFVYAPIKKVEWQNKFKPFISLEVKSQWTSVRSFLSAIGPVHNTVVRDLPIEHWDLIIEADSNNYLEEYQFEFNPLEDGRTLSARLNKLENPPFDQDDLNAWFTWEGEIPPGKRGNPNKSIPAYIEQVDAGRVKIEDKDGQKQLIFVGEALKGKWIAKQEDPNSLFWQFEKR